MPDTLTDLNAWLADEEAWRHAHRYGACPCVAHAAAHADLMARKHALLRRLAAA